MSEHISPYNSHEGDRTHENEVNPERVLLEKGAREHSELSKQPGDSDENHAEYLDAVKDAGDLDVETIAVTASVLEVVDNDGAVKTPRALHGANPSALRKSLEAFATEVGEDVVRVVTHKIDTYGVIADGGSVQNGVATEVPQQPGWEQLLLPKSDEVRSDRDASYEAELTTGEIYDRMELDRYARDIPLFRDIVATSHHRNDVITRVGDEYRRYLEVKYPHAKEQGQIPSFLGSESLWRMREELAPLRETITEGEAIQETVDVLDRAVDAGGDLAAQAQDMKDTLSYLGSKEYAEAAKGIAGYWEEILQHNPQTKLFIATTRTIHPSHVNGDQPKSDAYLLDAIMKEVGDETKDRVITSRELLDPDDPNVRAIILDDQTISGRQLWEMRHALPRQLVDTAEAQLLISPAEYLDNGIAYSSLKFGLVQGEEPSPLPVKSYYKAHTAAASGRVGAYVTGIYSTGDENFATIIANMADKVGVKTPGLVNIVRPYTLES